MPELDDHHWLQQAIDLSRSCPPSSTAFSVGAVIVRSDGEVLATGYSCETDPHDHAEEIALTKIPTGDPRLRQATIYTSLEPCSKRASRPRTCTELILAAGVARVVFAWREPMIFVDCEGAELLSAAGVEVIELRELASAVKSINAHVVG
jgi:diaminohydroxyphosphoribosylaminopyrimidine deaminase/5-amino-6-(5-phosphoribosylamino)uracil reductase